MFKLKLELLIKESRIVKKIFALIKESMRPLSCLILVALATLFLSTISFGQQPEHKVFAHYMVCCPFHSADIAGFKKDILDAQAAGIDGFALNCGGWFRESNYKTKSRAMYDAAAELGTGFKLFFSCDGCCGNNDSVARDMVRSFGRLPAQFIYKGKIFFSSWAFGDETLWRTKFATLLKKEGYDVYVVPYLYTKPSSETPDSSLIVQNCNSWWKDVFDGYFYFGAAGLPNQINESSRIYSKTWHSLNKTYMAPLSPTYWGRVQKNGRRYFEYSAGEGLESQWNTIIASQPDWVEIVTWNDPGESYICMGPGDNMAQIYGSPAARNSSFIKPHMGYLKLSRYFSDWYKTGVKPPITTNTLCYFYRTHPKDAVASDDPMGPVTRRFGTVEDVIYISTITKDQLEVRVTTGGKQHNVVMAPGIHHARIPFSVGNQHVEAYKKGIKVIDLDGEPIVSNISLYNFFLTSGFAVDSSKM